ncbi:hypothetical protein B0H13DRAFT_2411897 [Mycena leptocephala]|nr:hypothetical protein B0H13DRAFT_2411897 [Mycena leptocephala]
MSDILPNEIISQILSPALKVSKHLFSDTWLESPFASISLQPPSSFANLGFETLRTNPDLGRFVKNLRVEGFGKSMLKILKNTPNISHIVLRLYLHASDSSDGLAQGLPLINPTHLTIVDEIESFPHNNRPILGWEPLISISWDDLKTLAKTAGSTLQEFTGFGFYFERTAITYSPAIFKYFVVLRSFTWQCYPSVTFGPVNEASAAALPALEFLDVKTPEILSVVCAHMRLLSLRRVAFDNGNDWDAPSALATGSLVVRVSSFCIIYIRTDLIFAFENLEGSMNEIVDVVEFLVQSAAVLDEGTKNKNRQITLEHVLPVLLDFATNEQGSQSAVKTLKEGGKETLDYVMRM